MIVYIWLIYNEKSSSICFSFIYSLYVYLESKILYSFLGPKDIFGKK